MKEQTAGKAEEKKGLFKRIAGIFGWLFYKDKGNQRELKWGERSAISEKHDIPIFLL